jgi:hypothetical protein
MNWKFFCGSCILVGGLLIKLGAPLPAIALGMVMAAAAVRRWMATSPRP